MDELSSVRSRALFLFPSFFVLANNGRKMNIFFISSCQETPPPLPKSRPYTVMGNMKMGFPQTRLMKVDYPGESALCFSRFEKCNVWVEGRKTIDVLHPKCSHLLYTGRLWRIVLHKCVKDEIFS